MSAPNTDLLPPVFEQVLAYFDTRQIGSHVRQDIIHTLENGIVKAAAAGEREKTQRTISSSSEGDGGPLVLKTSDRLSGADLSRTALMEQLQAQVDLDTTILEVALLLIEAQIDLRLKGAGEFKISGISFSCDDKRETSIGADWWKPALDQTLKGATEDRPSVWSAFGKRKPAGIRVLVDTIQLCSALRDALPYRISIDRYLVEPLLEEGRRDSQIRLLHISDLHLVGDLHEEGRRMTKPIGAASHSFETARSVATAVRSLQPRYDFLVATGDLTTDGRRDSFETVLQYVQSGSISGQNPMRIAAHGLGAPRSKRILLPGNHDRYAGKLVIGQRLNDAFEQVLETPRQYPYVAGYRPHGASAESLTLLFFVFDSTLPEGRQGMGPDAWAKSIASGQVGLEELQKAEQLGALAAKTKKVSQMSGQDLEFEPSQTIRIALLHHHPVVTEPVESEVQPNALLGLLGATPKTVLEFRDKKESELVRMEDGDAFLRTCLKLGIQIVLFGHQHYPYQRLVTAEDRTTVGTPFSEEERPATLRAFCCPTTLEHGAKGNGFYVFDFLSRSRIQWASFGSLRTKDEGPGPMRQIASAIIDLDAQPTPEEKDSSYKVDLKLIN